MRTKLLRLTEEDYLLLVTMHHIISDRWSMQVFRRELLMLYTSMMRHDENALADVSAGFMNFVFAERQAILAGELDSQLDYWRKKLAARIPLLSFHKGFGERRTASFDMLRQPIEFTEPEFNKIKEIASRENCTRFMVLLAGLNVMLYSLTGDSDIRIGTLVANRGRREFQDLIGHFINTVILQVSISPKSTLRQFLRAVRADCVLAHANQEVPFEKVVSTLEKEQQIARESLCQVFLNYQSSVHEETRAPGFTLTPLDLQYSQVHSRATLTTFDLIFDFRESPTMLRGHVEHTTYLGRRQGSRIIKALRHIVDAFFCKPDEEIGAIAAAANTQRRPQH